MARRHRSDINQKPIVEAFRKVGASVEILSQVGDGVPDLLVGLCGFNFLVEVKNGSKAVLTPDQIKWHGSWEGQKVIVRSVEEALQLVSIVRRHCIKHPPAKICLDA